MPAHDDADRIPIAEDRAARAAPAWRIVDGRLEHAVRFATFVEAIAFVDEVAALAEAHDHHPDIDIRHRRVRLALSSHDVGALTARDVRLANAIADLAVRFGADDETRGDAGGTG